MKRRIGEMLIKEGLIQPGQLEEALEEQRSQGGKVVQILISKGFLSVEAFVHFLAKQPNITSIELQNFAANPAVVKLIPKEFALQHEVFPLDRIGDLLTLAMVCPLDSKTIDELQKMTKLRVKALLCPPEDVRAMIDRYYSPEGQPEPPALTMRSLGLVHTNIRLEGVADLVRKLDTLPSLPVTVRKIQEALENPDISMQEVADIVSVDPLVVAKLLRVVNSPAFAFLHRAETVTMAVTLLGLKETYLIVLASSVPDLFDKTNHFDYKGFWKKSLVCASACSAIAEAAKKRRSARFYTAGLLHDLGRAALAGAIPERYAKLSPSLRGQELIAVEEKDLGIGHPEAGFLLATAWGFPPEIAEPIRFHHAPANAKAAKESVAIVSVGATLMDIAEFGVEALSRWADQNAERLQEIGISKGDFLKVLPKAHALANELG